MTKQDMLASILGTITATICVVLALLELVPHGQWVYLGALVFGTVVITNKFNTILRG